MNILVTGAWQQAKDYIEIIESNGHSIQFLQWEKDPLPCDPVWVEGIIGNGIFLNHPIEQFSNLKYIQLISAGYDRVPMEYVQSHGIEIHNARGVYSIPMAEYAVAGVLCLYKKMTVFHENQKKHVWEKNRSVMELSGKKVLIIGCGSVGNACAKRFSAFDCNVVGVNRSECAYSYFDRIVNIDFLNKELRDTDILVLAVPLSIETYHLIGKDQFKQMPDTSIIINLARGEIVDQNALEEALEKSIIGGAVLDVFAEEPLQNNSKLWDMEKVIVTPHNSFVSNNNQLRLSKLILNNLKE